MVPVPLGGAGFAQPAMTLHHREFGCCCRDSFCVSASRVVPGAGSAAKSPRPLMFFTARAQGVPTIRFDPPAQITLP